MNLPGNGCAAPGYGLRLQIRFALSARSGADPKRPVAKGSELRKTAREAPGQSVSAIDPDFREPRAIHTDRPIAHFDEPSLPEARKQRIQRLPRDADHRRKVGLRDRKFGRFSLYPLEAPSDREVREPEQQPVLGRQSVRLAQVTKHLLELEDQQPGELSGS